MRGLSIHQKVKIRKKKNEHSRDTVEYFPVDNARYLYKSSKFVKNQHAQYGVRVIYTSKEMSKKFGVRVIYRKIR
jgi:hypothetical protein